MKMLNIVCQELVSVMSLRGNRRVADHETTTEYPLRRGIHVF